MDEQTNPVGGEETPATEPEPARKAARPRRAPRPRAKKEVEATAEAEPLAAGEPLSAEVPQEESAAAASVPEVAAETSRPARRRPRRRREGDPAGPGEATGLEAELAEVVANPTPVVITTHEPPAPEVQEAPVVSARLPESESLEGIAEVAVGAHAPEPADPVVAAELSEPLDTLVPEALLQPNEQAVLDAGEPIPLLRRDATAPIPEPPAAPALIPAVLPPAATGGALVLVPEAQAVLAPPDPVLDAADDLALALESGATPVGALAGIGLPLITPELLAEVRSDAPREREGRRDRQRGRDRDRKPREEVATLPGEPEPVVEAVALPTVEFILVPEALLELAPTEIVDDVVAVEADAGSDAAGRRRRRRGRDRDRDRKPAAKEQTAKVTTPPAEAPTSTPVPPPITERRPEPILLRAEDDLRERREREREKQPAAEREYKEILINAEERETRIAVLENGRLVELHVEREERVVGGVYRGRVANVLPGMDAAFVDIGLERNAFLYVGDILFDEPGRGGEGEGGPRRTSRDVRIKDLVKPGQELLVQVVKGPRGTKGARVSTRVSIPGRYLVLMPDADNLGVSRKIEDGKERDRLKRIVEPLQPKGFGLIVRTEAEGRSETELRQDLEYLTKAWQNIVDRNKRAHGPTSVHKDLGIILKTIRDLFGSDVDKLVVDSPEEYEKAVEALEQLAPDLVDRVSLYDAPEPLFIRYNIEEEIDRLLKRKVWLRNGAYLLIDATEALTTVDVNTGKFVGTSSLAETILKTNLDAVDEIARQLRLRDIGGMIVLDFIDMASARDRQLVMRALENAFKKDRTRIKIAHISPLGLVEMTRKRTAEAVTDVMSHVCSYCQGRGRVWSPETMAIQIEREIQRRCAKEEIDAILVYANPDVVEQLVGPEGESIERLERMLRRPIYARARHDYHVEKWEILPGDMLEMEQQMHPYRGGQVVECRVTASELVTPPRSAGWVDGFFVDLANAVRMQGQTVRVRLTDVRRSFALGEPLPPATAFDRSEPI